jgi:hypothetical protein
MLVRMLSEKPSDPMSARDAGIGASVALFTAKSSRPNSSTQRPTIVVGVCAYARTVKASRATAVQIMHSAREGMLQCWLHVLVCLSSRHQEK